MPDPRPAFEYPEKYEGVAIGNFHDAIPLATAMGIELHRDHQVTAEELWKLVAHFDVQIRHNKPPRKWKPGQPKFEDKIWIMISKKGEGFNQR